MNAIIDSYTQACIKLSTEEAQTLLSVGNLEGEIWRTTGETLPIIIKVSREGWRAEGIPIDQPYEHKKSYEIDVPPDGPDKILAGSTIGTDHTCVRLRNVYMSLDAVF